MHYALLSLPSAHAGRPGELVAFSTLPAIRQQCAEEMQMLENREEALVKKNGFAKYYPILSKTIQRLGLFGIQAGHTNSIGPMLLVGSMVEMLSNETL